MHKITVSGGPLMLGSGEIALLTAAQLSSRRHNVEVLEQSKDGSAEVRVIEPLHFKEGEELTLANVPKSATAAVRDQVKPAKAEASKNAPTKKALKASFDEGFAKGRADGLKTLADEVEKAKVQVRKAARAELLAEIETRNGLVDALEAAVAEQEGLSSDADDEARAAAQKAVDEAQAAVDKLQPLEA
jgi:hypothetical protein